MDAWVSFKGGAGRFGTRRLGHVYSERDVRGLRQLMENGRLVVRRIAGMRGFA
ncbi:hypothetical protein [Paenibacillus sp. HW567]|uniref:hypothetical protein n=1 Tax=Paenibacillus sp. HW567 TaxID=1034769 RepID=UPI0003A97508|nr:hypothetical protein [Paenibacillus sp. HW567]